MNDGNSNNKNRLSCFDVIPLNNVDIFLKISTCHLSLFEIIKRIICFSQFEFYLEI